MARPRLSRMIWTGLGYTGLCLALMALRLMPQSMLPGGWPGPDLVLCVTFAWVLRRPDALAPLLIAAVALTGDLLLQRPPGLGAALTVMACELLRRQAQLGHPLSVLAEWGIVTGMLMAMAALTWGALGLTFTPGPDLTHLLSAAAVTALIYPLSVAVLWVIGLRRPVLAQRSGWA